MNRNNPLSSRCPAAGASRRGLGLLLLVLGCFTRLSADTPLTLHPDRASAYDLAVTGRLAGVPSGETRFVRWAELRRLPTSMLTLKGAFGAGASQVTALFLSDLWAALPHSAEADVLLATCNDGYVSVYRLDFMATYRPFLVMEISGAGPADWPPPGLKFNPGPYVITVAAEVVPAVATLLDAGHKRPWRVVTLELASYADRFAGAYRGPWAEISPRAAEGRDIWINSCASCHRGPGHIFGGTKSDRPFEVLVAHAAYNAAYFRQYVRDPKSRLPGATMEPHPHYTDEQLAALIAFITAESK